MRAACPVIDVLPVIGAILTTVWTFEHPVTGTQGKRHQLRFTSIAPANPFRWRLMLRHFHIRAAERDQACVELA